MNFTEYLQDVLKEKYRTIRHIEYRTGKDSPRHEMTEKLKNSFTIRVTFRGPTPAHGPMGTIQELFCPSYIHARYVEMPRGRPRNSSFGNSRGKQPLPQPLPRKPSPAENAEMEYASILKKKPLLVSKRDGPSSASNSFSYESFEYLPSTELPRYNLSFEGATTDPQPTNEVSIDPPGMNVIEPRHIKDRLGEGCSDLYDEPPPEYPALSTISPCSSSSMNTDLPGDSLSSTGHSMSSKFLQPLSSPSNESGKVQQGTGMLYKPTQRISRNSSTPSSGKTSTGDSSGSSSHRPKEFRLVADPYGRATCTVVSGPDGHLSELSVHIATNQGEIKGVKWCTLVLSGNEETIKEVIGGSVAAAFYVDEVHSLIVEGSMIRPHSISSYAVSDLVVPGLESLFPELGAIANVQSVSCDVYIWIKLPYGTVIQFESPFLRVLYILPETVVAGHEIRNDNVTNEIPETKIRQKDNPYSYDGKNLLNKLKIGKKYSQKHLGEIKSTTNIYATS